MVEDYRRHLYETLHAAARDFDQAILTAASSTLALSVTFTHHRSPTPTEASHRLLLFGWLALAAAIVSIIGSFLASQRVLRQAIEALHAGRPAQAPWAAALTTVLSWMAGGSLVVGLF